MQHSPINGNDIRKRLVTLKADHNTYLEQATNSGDVYSTPEFALSYRNRCIAKARKLEPEIAQLEALSAQGLSDYVGCVA